MGVVVAPSRGPRGFRGALHRAASDERLLERLRAGDDTAFEALYDRYHRGILAFCRHMLADHGEGEDALQQTFVSALPALRKEGREVHVRAFLYAIARNRCLSIIRARRESVSIDDVQVATAGLPASVEVRADLRELLADLQRLPDDQRAALLLAEVGDLSHDDVAEVLGVRRDKVKAIVFQGRENLMRWRDARHTDCRDIREQLATLRGGALRRTQLREHLAECESCRAFKLEVARQRSAMASVMPVAPSVALKGSVLAAALGGTGTGAALMAGLGGAGGGLAGGLTSKFLTTVVLASSAGAGGYAAVEGVDLNPMSRDRAPAAERAASVASRSPLAGSNIFASAVMPPPAATPAVTRTPAAAGKPAKKSGRKKPKKSAGTTAPAVAVAQGNAADDAKAQAQQHKARAHAQAEQQKAQAKQQRDTQKAAADQQRAEQKARADAHKQQAKERKAAQKAQADQQKAAQKAQADQQRAQQKAAADEQRAADDKRRADQKAADDQRRAEQEAADDQRRAAQENGGG